MPVIARYGFVGNDFGLLAIAFPLIRVLKPPFYPFVCEPRVIVITDERDFRAYPDKEVIQITSRASIKLDTRDGFLAFLAQSDVKATASQLEALRGMNDLDFWNEVKLARVLGRFPTLTKEWISSGSNIFKLFITLFDDFGATYRHYHLSGRPYPVVVSSLMTMMIKARKVEAISVSPQYKKVLRKNRIYVPLFSRALLEYFQSPMREIDFLTFLAECSHHTRHEPWRRWGFLPWERD